MRSTDHLADAPQSASQLTGLLEKRLFGYTNLHIGENWAKK